MAPVIRPAVTADEPALIGLFRQVHALHVAARPDLFDDPGEGRAMQEVALMLSDTDAALLVAEAGGAVVGLVYVVLEHRPRRPGALGRRTALTDVLAVDEAWRGRGIGTALMQAAVEWGEGQGVDEHLVRVHAFNRGARRLYEQLGYETSVTTLRLTPDAARALVDRKPPGP
jgi:GNAT superfamily N-acetyltransferase